MPFRYLKILFTLYQSSRVGFVFPLAALFTAKIISGLIVIIIEDVVIYVMITIIPIFIIIINVVVIKVIFIVMFWIYGITVELRIDNGFWGKIVDISRTIYVIFVWNISPPDFRRWYKIEKFSRDVSSYSRISKGDFQRTRQSGKE